MATLRADIGLSLLVLSLGACGPLPDSAAGNGVSSTPDVAEIVQATFDALTAQAGGALSLPPATADSPAESGSISGALRYPAESLPPLYVTAYQIGSRNYRFVITNAGQSTFQIDGLPAGTYHLVAYTVGGGGFPAGLAGGYTEAVPCGLSASCTDHTLRDVQVVAGQSTAGISPSDWYAPASAFPPFPEQPPAPSAQATLPAALADGAIAGSLSYPSSGLPAMRVVALDVMSAAYYFTETGPGQSSYELDHVPPGTYHVIAYTLPGGGFPAGMAGGYSQMVLCGLQAGCDDHTLVSVEVIAGTTTTGINPGDFYAEPAAFPPDPVP